jgi:hypothetical protein
MVEDKLLENFYNCPLVQKNISKVKNQILNSEILPTAATELLLNIFNSSEEDK